MLYLHATLVALSTQMLKGALFGTLLKLKFIIIESNLFQFVIEHCVSVNIKYIIIK